eukprot:CCRYP_010864-RA/>CCRYP_010864-RA protein AED:0.14 eAED:0.14 QI:61/1/1/1/0.5/0.33/3/1538/458
MGSSKKSRKAATTTSTQKVHTSNNSSNNDEDSSTASTDLDFCQRFFGDPLFSNLNVTLLFLLATFLPMLVWIPHFINEYVKLRRSSLAESERMKRMERSRIDLMSMNPEQRGELGNLLGVKMQDFEEPVVLADGRLFYRGKPPRDVVIKTPFSEDDVTILEQDVFGVQSNLGGDNVHANNRDLSFLLPSKPSVLPTLCPDGITMGFDNWFTLRDAVSEANALAAEDFLRWNKYLVMMLRDPDIDPPVFTTPDPFVICPGVKLNQKHPPRMSILAYLASFLPFSTTSSPSSIIAKHNKNKLSSIFINAEDITIECDRCLIDLPGTHFSFGPHARNILIKGITFKSATTSSLTFHHHGATASFQDCYWLYNSGGIVASKNNPIGTMNLEGNNVGGTMNAGAVADVNSTSSVTFYRCSIDDQRQNPRRATVGAGLANVPGMNPTPTLGHGHPPGGNSMIPT